MLKFKGKLRNNKGTKPFDTGGKYTMESYKSEFIDFLPVHFYRPRECPQMLDFTGFEGIFNLKGNYRKMV